jgi:PQQ-dependent catabolism-associated CXXCW motif protein
MAGPAARKVVFDPDIRWRLQTDCASARRLAMLGSAGETVHYHRCHPLRADRHVGFMPTPVRILIATAVIVLPVIALAEVQIPLPQPAQSFSYEEKDWGIEPTSTPKLPPYGAPTPRSIPGARVISTLQLKSLLDADKSVVVIDVLNSKTRTTIPGAHWLPGAGDGRFGSSEKSRFAVALEKLTGGDKSRPLVFLCLSSECWESYNACLHAIEAGYNDVIWYRGGTNAWSGASLDRKQPDRVTW